ncbi:FmdB family zinc ribbon protein [Terrabacter sp. NPDC000476]|uniref:FmdB family zinc ribbon protein n=1 Tax=Terrabacter sp. NPDC000476 TaxID=3154258 RepID=UPI0033189C7E
MPTYSYACPECGHAFDIRQSFTDDALTVCPECGAPRLRKVIHPVGIAFKGSGFYKTDSRASTKGSGSTTPTEKSSGSDSGAKGSSTESAKGSTSGSSTAGTSGSSTSSTSSSSGSSGSSGSASSTAP